MRLVLVPGFTQPASAWDAVRAHLPADLDVVALDVPDGLDLAGTVHALGEAGGPAVYCGYSMGARLALRLALDEPELVDALIMVSGTAGIEDDAERAARREADDALAAEIESGGVDAFLDRWLTQPLFAGLSHDAAGMDARKAHATTDRLAHHLRALGQGVAEPVWERLEELDVPVALFTGETDERYDEVATRMFELIDDCLHRRLPGGHAILLEHPRALAAAITSFLHDITE